MEKRKDIVSLFLSFIKISAFTFGGGYAMIPLIEHEFVVKRKWIEEDEFMNLTVIAESTPGPIAINSATYIGYKRAGFLGSIASTVGVVLPSFLIIYIISIFFSDLLSVRFIASAFKGISVAVSIVIIAAGIKMLKKIFGKKKTAKERSTPAAVLIICFVITMLGRFTSFRLSTVWLILITACVGSFIYALKRAKKGGAKQ